jgi:hypothetical protein
MQTVKIVDYNRIVALKKVEHIIVFQMLAD